MKRGGIKGKLLTLNKRKQDDRRKGCWEGENREGEAREGGTIRKRGKGGDVGQPRWEGGIRGAALKGTQSCRTEGICLYIRPSIHPLIGLGFHNKEK